MSGQSTNPVPFDSLPNGIPSRAAVLEIIKDVARELSGDDAPIDDEDTPLDAYLDEQIYFGDLLFVSAQRFGMQLHRRDFDLLDEVTLARDVEEWKLLNIPYATFGRLADLLHKRLEQRQIEPVTISGISALSASAFFWLECALMEIDAKSRPIEPSTKVVERFRGSRLEELWARCRLVADGRLPTLQTPVSIRITGKWLGLLTLGVVTISPIIPVFWAKSFPPTTLEECLQLLIHMVVFGLILSTPALIVLVIVVVVVRGVVGAVTPTRALLPTDIVTFADLARVITGERGGWCQQCNYDLTGLASDKCPECGTARNLRRR